MKSIFSYFLIVLLAASVSLGAVRTGYKRLIVFGDSLSDVGTYTAVAGKVGGGKYTTNPGKIWVENVATELLLPLKPNRYEGFGLPTQIVGGLNYAQGGARVTLEQPKSGQPQGSARPIVVQTQYYLQQYRTFTPMDLVLIQGGANDLFAQIQALKENKITPADAVKNMATAGMQLVEIVRKLRLSGAQHVFITNLPMIQVTPFALSLPPQMQALIQQMVLTFNGQLTTLSRTAGAKLIDFYSFEVAMSQNYAKYGIKNITHPACNVKALPNNSSLYCNATTLVEPAADRTFKYADMVHPSSGFYVIIGKFVLSEILRQSRR